jgi:Na+-driven multidrug efflux pump
MLAAPFSVSTFVLNNVLRYEGRASLAMLGLVSGAIINIVCDPILMFGLNLGIAGAGISTAISQLISFAILIYMFLSGKTQSKISLKRFTKNIPLILDIMGTGLPSLMRQALTSVSTMLLNQQARVYGDAAVAGMSIVTKITMFIFAVGLGLGQGFQPVCGFNYGAGIYSRVKKAFKSTFILAEIMLGIMAVIGLCLSNQAIGLFRNDPDVIAFGTPALKFQCAGLFLQPMVVLSNMTLQSSGQKFRATLLSMLRSGIYFIPSLYLMAALFGATGIQATQTVADVLSFSTSVPFIAYYLIHLPKDRKNQEYV